jgi:hypothetical protein
MELWQWFRIVRFSEQKALEIPGNFTQRYRPAIDSSSREIKMEKFIFFDGRAETERGCVHGQKAVRRSFRNAGRPAGRGDEHAIL